MCSLHLTHPSAHTPGAVGTVHSHCLSIVLCKYINRAVSSFHKLEWQKYFNNSDITYQLRNAIKYNVSFVIAYFNIPKNIIQLINIIQWIIIHSLAY